MNPRLFVTALVVGVVGAAGCGQQQLAGGLGAGGTTGSGGSSVDAAATTSTGGTTGTGGTTDGGCPAELLISCGSGTVGCEHDPVCVNGAWTCTPDIICPVDAGATKDAGGCPSIYSDAGILWCGCGSDSTPPPVCTGGRLTCPAGSSGPFLCPRYCSLQAPPPPGCTCNSANGIVTCQHDGGADAPPGGHNG